MRFIILAVLCFMPGSVQAQPSPPLTVENAVALAVKNNPRLLAVAQDIVAAQSGVRSARALTNPTFFFAPAITNPAGSDEELLLTQPLELNGTRGARAGVASAQLRVTQSEAVVELRNIVFATKSAYYELARAQEQLALTRSLLTTAEGFDRLTRRLVEEGRRPGIELAQTGIEVTRARQQVTLAEGQVTAAAATLNTQMGRSPSEPLGALSPLTTALEDTYDEAALSQALASRAEIASAQATRDVFRQEARLARAEGRPDLAPQFRAGSLTRGVDAGVGIAVSLPLFDWGSRRNRIRQAEESARAQEARITAVQNQVRQEVTQAQARLLAAQAVVRDYQQGVLDQARRLLEGSRTGFQAGAAGTSVLNVLEAQRTYRSVQTEYLNALVNYAQARAELERVTGTVPADLLSNVTRTGVPRR